MPKRSVASPNSPKRKSVKKPKPIAGGKIHGNTSRDHIHRIYIILAELQNSRYPSREDLAELCCVSTKTIERDLRSMEALMGVAWSWLIMGEGLYCGELNFGVLLRRRAHLQKKYDRSRLRTGGCP